MSFNGVVDSSRCPIGFGKETVYQAYIKQHSYIVLRLPRINTGVLVFPSAVPLLFGEPKPLPPQKKGLGALNMLYGVGVNEQFLLTDMRSCTLTAREFMRSPLVADFQLRVDTVRWHRSGRVPPYGTGQGSKGYSSS